METSATVTEILRSAPGFCGAIKQCAETLRQMAEYELDDITNITNTRLRELGERKDSLSAEEKKEFFSLLTFCEKRTVEVLEAKAALAKLNREVPELMEMAV